MFSRPKLCPKRASSCASSNSEVQTPLHILSFPLSSQNVTLSLSSPTWLLSIALFVSQTFLWKKSFIWDHWTFILIYFCTKANTVYCCNTASPFPTEGTTLGSHQVILFWKSDQPDDKAVIGKLLKCWKKCLLLFRLFTLIYDFEDFS